MSELSEKSQIKLDVKALIGMIVGVVSIAGIWFSLTAETTRLRLDLTRMEETVESNHNWIIEFEPPESVQETVIKLRKMEIENALLHYRIEQLEKELGKNLK